ncbi:glycoside hydrolase family 16 protein [Arthrobacter liuii]
MGVLSLTGCTAAPSPTGAAATMAGHESIPPSAAPIAPSAAPSTVATPETQGAGDTKPPLAGASHPTKAAAPPSPSQAVPAAAVGGASATASNQNGATTGDGTQAAAILGWGPVVAGDEFSNTGTPDPTKWTVYNGPGHAGNGIRSPQAWSVANGVATVSGDAVGATGGMSAKFAQQKYGRWETRMRSTARDPKYHPVLILWPNNNASPNCAEIDYAEGNSDSTMMKFFLHYACSGADHQAAMSTPVDSNQWHNYAVEWTPSGITGYVDGVKTFTDTTPAHQPSVGMHQTLQLDWFPDGSATKPSQMQVDWVRVYK